MQLLLVWQQILLYLLSDGSRVNRLWLGWCCLLVSLGSVQTSKITDVTDACISDILVVWITCCRVDASDFSSQVDFYYSSVKIERVMLCGVEVKSEQVSLESFIEDGKWLCCPDFGQEFFPPQRRQNREELWRPLFALSDGGTSRLACGLTSV